MRSRAEWTARVLVLLLLIAGGWRLVAAPGAGATVVSSAEAERQLASGPLTPRSIHLRTGEVAPPPAVRDWLGGLARAGSAVSWSGAPRSLAIDAEPLREPGGRWQFRVIAGSAAALRDTLGLLDSLAAGGSSVRMESSPARIAVDQDGVRAQASGGSSEPIGRVLVLGRVGWESKFVITALEEAGWRVAARLRLGGGREVRQGAVAEWRAPALAAVVLLDSVPDAELAPLARYLREGGGVVLAGSAIRIAPLRGVLPARAVSERPAPMTPDPTLDPRLSLGRWILAPNPEGVVSDGVGAVPLVVARRVARGRLAQVAVRESWRWRMESEGEGVADHRQWWSRVVGQVAATPFYRADPASREGAPVARLFSALGDPTDVPQGTPDTDTPLPAFILPIILLLLLGEWGSRRLRGSR